MCCRYYTDLSPELRPYVEAAKASRLGRIMIEKLGKPLVTEGEVFPTNMVPVIATDKNGRQQVFPMVWGFNITGLNKPVVNARVETAYEKKSFKEAWYKRRCIIPASWYYEWDHRETISKYSIQPSGSSVTYLAGIYQIQEYRNLKYPVFAVLTREPAGELKKIHDRMPLIFRSESINDWIDPDKKPEDLLDMAVTDLIAEKCV